MALDILHRIILFIVFCLAQSLVLNYVQLFHCATPMLYVYFVVMYPRNFPKWAALLWAFFLGLCIDVFSNTPGVATASMTLIALIQPYLLELFIPHDAFENLVPKATTLGWDRFLTFTGILSFIYCTVFFTLEAFTFFNWQNWLLCIFGSTVLTFVLIVSLESLRINKTERD